MIWTQFKIPTGQCFYIDSVNGNDSNTGASDALAMKSIPAAMPKLKAGSRLYLKRGCEFILKDSIAWKPSSEDPQAQAGIFAYGDESLLRPILTITDQTSITFPTAGHNRAIVDIHLRAIRSDKTKEPTGILTGAKQTNLLVEGCLIDNFSYNINFNLGNDPITDPSKNLIIRGCTILNANAYSAAFAGQGIYTENVDGLLIEDNYLYNNGNASTQYRHGMYLSHHGTINAIVQRNLVAKSCSFGIQLRGNGVVKDNFLIDNGVGLSIGGSDGEITNNFIYGAHDVSDAQTYQGIGINSARTVCQNNLIWDPAGISNDTKPPAIEINTRDWTPKDIPRTLNLFQNVVIGWPTEALQLDQDPWDTLTINGLLILNPKRRLIIMRAPVRVIDFDALFSNLPDLGVDFAGSAVDSLLAKFQASTVVVPILLNLDPTQWLNQRKGSWNVNFEALALMNTFRPPITVTGVSVTPVTPVTPVSSTGIKIKLQADSALAQIKAAQLTNTDQSLKTIEQQILAVKSLTDSL